MQKFNIKVIRYFLSKHYFGLGTVSIVILAGFFRFWNYGNRWGLAYDQGQFAVVARYALETVQLPLLGPFSSGGPFQTGGEWYWIVMLGTALYPKFVLSPWIFVTLLTIFAVFVMIMVGKIYNGKIFGLLLGFLLALSPVQIYQSTNLTNQTPIVLFSALTILFALIFTKTGKSKFVFFLALVVGSATSVHIQSVALMPFIFFVIVFFRKNILKNIILISLGLGIPWIPVLIADMQNNFYNTTSMIMYFTNNQAQVSYDVLGRRWLTFIIDFIPTSWGNIIGGNIVFGYFFIITATIFAARRTLNKKIKKETLVIFLSIGVMFIILRYVKTPLFESFFVFIHPFIILVSGWTIFQILKLNRFLGVAVMFIIAAGSIYSFWGPINTATNTTYEKVLTIQKVLYERYPNETFSIYDYQSNNSSIVLPLVLNLYIDDRVGNEGRSIGVYRRTPDHYIQIEQESLYGDQGALQIFDISSSESSQLEDIGWRNDNPETVYDETQHWFRFNTE